MPLSSFSICKQTFLSGHLEFHNSVVQHRAHSLSIRAAQVTEKNPWSERWPSSVLVTSAFPLVSLFRMIFLPCFSKLVIRTFFTVQPLPSMGTSLRASTSFSCLCTCTSPVPHCHYCASHWHAVKTTRSLVLLTLWWIIITVGCYQSPLELHVTPWYILCSLALHGSRMTSFLFPSFPLQLCIPLLLITFY